MSDVLDRILEGRRTRFIHYVKQLEQNYGYPLHVWTWADAGGVIHQLTWPKASSGYVVFCTRITLLDSDRVPYTEELPTCLWCVLGRKQC